VLLCETQTKLQLSTGCVGLGMALPSVLEYHLSLLEVAASNKFLGLVADGLTGFIRLVKFRDVIIRYNQS